jgi:hypothetical protein
LRRDVTHQGVPGELLEQDGIPGMRTPARSLAVLLVTLTAFGAAFASEAGVASASALNVTGAWNTVVTCKTGCGVKGRMVVAGQGMNPGPDQVVGETTFRLFQMEGSNAVTGSDMLGNQLSGTASGGALDFTIGSGGASPCNERIYKATVSADGTSWSGIEEVVDPPLWTGAKIPCGEVNNGPPLAFEALSFMIAATRAGSITKCIVPNLKGKKLATAEKAIVLAHCAVGKVKKARNRHVKKGRVVAQSPAAGKSLPAGTTVSLVVSRG